MTTLMKAPNPGMIPAKIKMTTNNNSVASDGGSNNGSAGSDKETQEGDEARRPNTADSPAGVNEHEPLQARGFEEDRLQHTMNLCIKEGGDIRHIPTSGRRGRVRCGQGSSGRAYLKARGHCG